MNGVCKVKMSKRNEWLNDNETVIYQSFVDYWVTYREIILKKYPNIHNEINSIVNYILDSKKVKIK